MIPPRADSPPELPTSGAPRRRRGRPRRARRWLVGGIVLGSLIAILFAVMASWPGIERFVRLVELRRDVALLETYLPSEDPAKAAAARRFLRESDVARRALAELYVLELERSEFSKNAWWPLEKRADTIREGALALGPRSYDLRTTYGSDRKYSQASMPSPPLDEARRRAVLEQLAVLEGREFRAERFPGFEFRVERLATDRKISPEWREPRADSTLERIPFRVSNRAGYTHALFFRPLRKPR